MVNDELRQLGCIVKMGGAAITHKDRLETVDVEKLSITCRQIRDSMMKNVFSSHINMDWSKCEEHSASSSVPELSHLQNLQSIHMDPFIVIHGAGSFGHFQASRSNVHKGGLETTLGKAGFVATRISVTKLNHEVVRALASQGIPAVGISPFAGGWSTHNRTLEQYDISVLRRAIEADLVPVLHGDVVFDSSQGCTILSGDVVLRKLAEELKPKHAVFLTDVPGVFDRPPSEPDAVLIQEIVVNEDGSWKITKPDTLSLKTGVETSAAAHDTTGGMATKIAEAAIIAKAGVDVYIVEVGTGHALEALQCRTNLNDKWVGTIVRASS